MCALKKVLLILFISVPAFFCHCSNILASHAMGAELTYECISQNQYILTYSFYRDCDGVAAPASVNVNYTSSCFPGGFVNLIPQSGSPTQIGNVCPSATTTCNGGVYTGIEEWVYSATITLPGPCQDWKFSYAECCRNSAISTVDSPGAYNLYVFSLLNNFDVLCNSSPFFLHPPVQSVCVGQSYCFINGASDIDGDSLAYQLITPLAATGTPITYKFPYSYSQPVISSPSVTFNALTGDLCMRPTQSDVSPFAVLVSEYREGVLIGQVERDIQIEVVPCTNALPQLSAHYGSSVMPGNLCAGISYDFFLASLDINSSQQTTISYSSDITGASISNTGGLRDTLFISWTPTLSDVLTSPHCISASVRDDNCPYLGIKNYNFCFNVLDPSDPDCLSIGIKENAPVAEVRVFRESFGNSYKLLWKEPHAFTSVSIFDSSGRLLFDLSVEGKVEADIRIENLSSGLYHLRMSGVQQWSKSIVKE
jgi:hypothetical protein